MKLARLEALRGFAAVYVVVHHIIQSSSSFNNNFFLFRFGQEAVILFFLISGFVINYSFKQSIDKSFRSYFFKRATRIYIPLLIVMLLSWLLESIRTGSFAAIRAGELLLNIMMLQDVGALKPNVIVEPYMHNSPLWSLSYEWWFYMLYFPLQKYISSDKKQSLIVFSVSILAAFLYAFYPSFIPRLLMYMSIWWTGTVIANIYMSCSKINMRGLVIPIASLILICAINGVVVSEAVTNGGYKSIGVYPALELRHHLFAVVAIVIALYWQSQNWILFDKLFMPFHLFAPISYVVYISHYHLIVRANYLAFIDNRFVELLLYIAVMLAFAIAVEKNIYPYLQRIILNKTVMVS